MKKIKYIIYSLALLTILSCGDDDFSRAYVDDEVKTALTGQLDLSRTVSAPRTRLDFTFTLPQSFSVESTVEVTATTYDFKQSKAYVVVPAGQSAGSGSITTPGAGTVSNSFFGINDFASVQLTGVALKQPETGSVDDPYTLSSEAISIRLIDYHSDYMVARATSLDMLLDWVGPWDVNDLDMYVYNSVTFANVEFAESGSRYEGDLFNNTHPDGEYFVAIGFYTVSGEDIPYNFYFTYPDGKVEYYEGNFTVPSAGDFLYPIINISKSTDGNGNAVYATSLPE